MTPAEVIAMRDKLAAWCRTELDIEDYGKSLILAEAMISSGWVTNEPKGSEGE